MRFEDTLEVLRSGATNNQDLTLKKYKHVNVYTLHTYTICLGKTRRYTPPYASYHTEQVQKKKQNIEAKIFTSA